MSKINIPRPLYDKEIEDILSGIEPITWGLKSANQLAQDEIKNLLRTQLQSIELVPAAIPEMKRTIRNQYYRSQIEPQTPVGFLVSEALSQPITQMTLNSVVSETQIVICDKEKGAKVVQIGQWIDELMSRFSEKIKLFPENRTEYLELDTPVFIPSTTSDGKTTEWMELTAVTRHLPVGDLIKIKTRTGKEVTATSQKSFLVYDETQDKLVEKDGSRIQVGDKVGIQLHLENQDLCPFDFLEIKYDEKWNCIGLEAIVSIEKISARTDPSDENSPLKNVYDVTVPKSLNFNLFNGLVMSDTFHNSGSSKNMSSGIDALRELFNVSEARKAYNMVIQFNTCNLDYEDVFEMIGKVVEVSFGSLIKKYEYLPSTHPIPDWTNGYLRLTKQQLPTYEWSLRLFLDTNRMLSFKISISKIIQMIKEKAPPNIVVVPSPMAIGILDLYPVESEIDTQLGANSTLLFLSVSVLPILQDFLISGIKGVEGMFPTSNSVLSIISEEIPVEKGGNVFYLAFSRSVIKKTGLGIEELEKLFSFVNIEILDPKESGISPQDGAYVVMPEEAKTAQGYEYPMKYVKELLSREEKAMNAEEQRVKQEAVSLADKNLSQEEILRIQSKARGYMAKPSEFYQASKCWYAETNGKNFIEVIKLPEVDPYYSYSNDFHEISEILGIEATRNLLVIEFKNVLLSEEYINTRHIGLLVDIMTNLGRLTPISFYGANRFGQGAMSLSTNQQTMKVFTQAAAFGKKENVDSVSASIMLGKQAKIGAGFVQVLPAKSKASIPPQPSPVVFGDKVDELYKNMMEEDLTPDSSMESKQAYNDIMTVSIPSKIYVREQKKEPKNLAPTDVQIAPPKIISPNLVQIASSIKDIQVIGENTIENSVIYDPEAEGEIVNEPISRNQTVTEKIELSIPSAEPEPAPSAPLSFVKKSKPPVPSAPAPVTSAQVPSLPMKKKTEKKESSIFDRLRAKQKEIDTLKTQAIKSPVVDVDKSINALSNL